MKRLLLALALLTPGIAVASLSPVTDNGVTWLINYDPDTELDPQRYDKAPNDSLGTFLGGNGRYFGGPGGTGVAKVVDNYLQTTTSLGNKLEYNTTWGYTPSSENGITIEARLRVVEMTGTQFTAGFLLGAGLVEGGTQGYYVPIPFSATKLGDVSGLDLTEWTIVRFTIQPGISAGAPTLSIYINNNPVASYVGAITALSTEATTYNRIRFGNYYTATSETMGGTVDWDYIRWTSEGAYAPIPEPSTALLTIGGCALGLGGLMARRRRH